jgi:hypothetical protein
MDRATQKLLILAHLMLEGPATTWELMTKYHIGRVASRVFDLRKDGYPIQTTMIHSRDEDGTPVQYALYSLPQEG